MPRCLAGMRLGPYTGREPVLQPPPRPPRKHYPPTPYVPDGTPPVRRPYGSGPAKRDCAVCGNPFAVRAKTQRTCSLKCGGEFKAANNHAAEEVRRAKANAIADGLAATRTNIEKLRSPLLDN